MLEHGDRVAVTACGSVLASLGATVCYVERPSPAGICIAPAHREAKELVPLRPDAIDAACARADCILTSSDTVAHEWRRTPSQIHCDITAYGSSGPLAGTAHSDALVQAMCGLADTTGESNGPPTVCAFPQIEGIAALYAAAGVLATQLTRARTGLAIAWKWPCSTAHFRRCRRFCRFTSPASRLPAPEIAMCSPRPGTYIALPMAGC